MKTPVRLNLNEPTHTDADPERCYPDEGRLGPLRNAIAALHQVAASNVVVTNGADGGLDVAARAAHGRGLIGNPDFIRYRDHLRNAGRAIDEIPIPELPAEFPADKFINGVNAETGIIVIGTVGNPMGYVLPGQAFLERIHARQPDSLLVLDEVYSRFTGADFTRYAADTRGVISIWSLSKVGFPGIRVGYMVAHPSTLAQVQPFVSPFPIAGPSAETALEVVRDIRVQEEMVGQQIAARQVLECRLREMGLPFVASPANWVLLDAGAVAARVAAQLEGEGYRVSRQVSANLPHMLRISTPNVPTMNAFAETLGHVLEAPFTVEQGVISFKQEYFDPAKLADASFAVNLFGRIAEVDHYVVTLGNLGDLTSWVKQLVGLGGRVIEGPGTWPTEFCSNNDGSGGDLAMHFAAVAMPEGIIVLSAPLAAGDQLSRFLADRGPRAMHHVAIKTTDMRGDSESWRGKGFQALSREPVSDGVLSQWFHRNAAGQIIELIQRADSGDATFTCNNIAALRMSEAQK